MLDSITFFFERMYGYTANWLRRRGELTQLGLGKQQSHLHRMTWKPPERPMPGHYARFGSVRDANSR